VPVRYFWANRFRAVKATLSDETTPGLPASGERRLGVALEELTPVGNAAFRRAAGQTATIGIFVLLLIGALWFARPMLLPATTAIVIGLMLGPLSAQDDRLRIPSTITAIVMTLLVIGAFYAIIVILSAPLGEWIAKAPEIGASIRQKLSVLDRPLAALRELREAVLPPGKDDPGVSVDLVAMVQPAVLFITPAIGQVVIFFGTLFFYLLGRLQVRHVLVAFFEERKSRLRTLRIMNDIEHSLTSYLSLVAIINTVVGLGAFAIAYAVGLPSPAAWGVLGFLLNFIPYIGAFIMEFIMLSVGLVAFPTLTHALIGPLMYIAFTTLEGHFVTPAILGRQLTLNPLTVFLSLVFWTWLWGPIGAFLAVPLLIVMLVVAGHLVPGEPDLPE
jgi:predicted PurR-regulated permease PerM